MSLRDLCCACSACDATNFVQQVELHAGASNLDTASSLDCLHGRSYKHSFLEGKLFLTTAKDLLSHGFCFYSLA